LSAHRISASAFHEHIRILPVGHRQQCGPIFSKVGEAILKRRRLHIGYTDYQGVVSERDVSPQTLVHYRDNWYLDAWCHLRNQLRTFSIARITRVEALQSPVKKVDAQALRTHFSSSYGIFSGKARHQAKIRFGATVAREVALQQWHPDQRGKWDGREYVLSFPYSDDRELLQDLLRLTPHVYVESPVALRKQLQNRLQQGLEVNLGKGLGLL